MHSAPVTQRESQHTWQDCPERSAHHVFLEHTWHGCSASRVYDRPSHIRHSVSREWPGSHCRPRPRQAAHLCGAVYSKALPSQSLQVLLAAVEQESLSGLQKKLSECVQERERESRRAHEQRERMCWRENERKMGWACVRGAEREQEYERRW